MRKTNVYLYLPDVTLLSPVSVKECIIYLNLRI